MLFWRVDNFFFHTRLTNMSSKPRKSNERVKEEYEFGGPVGGFIIILMSHFIPYYFWYCLEFNNSSLAFPSIDILSKIISHAYPNWYAVKLYMGFIVFEVLLAWFYPGLQIEGLPIPHEGNRRLKYNINAIQSWYVTLAVVALLHFSGIIPLSHIMEQYAPMLTTAIIFSNLVSLFIHMYALVFPKHQCRMSGNQLYDFFIGSVLNPRLGSLDLKMYAEARISWILLFLLTVGAAAKQYELFGYVSLSMWFMIVAHGLYCNAIMKGEECIPYTWDMFHEKWGWYLIYWNFAGVPFVYCFQSIYILKNSAKISLPPWFHMSCFITLLLAYYVWDTAQSQRNRFRMMWNDTYVPRNTFPQLPWGTLDKNAKHLDTRAGSKLLIDGWWAYARKIHYTMDIIMALLWGLVCGFDSFIPYFYVIFFTAMIIHRNGRDQYRCAKKYGEDWVKYTSIVPYVFIPRVY